MNYYLMKEETEVDIYNNLEIESRISKIGNWHCSVLSIWKKKEKRFKKQYVW